MAAKKKVEDVVYPLALPIAEKNHCDLVEVEFKKEGPDWFLRIFIDKEDGITLDDCEYVSKELSDILDEVDPIEQSYYLEVSSPGINRQLKTEKDFERFKEEKIQIKLYRALDGTKELSGILEDYSNDIISIRTDDDSIIKINKAEAALVRLA